MRYHNHMIKKPYLLIVEDDPILGTAMRDKFVSVGFKVKIASDGDLAIKELGNQLPQVVLLDILLPHKNGFDILSEMKSHPVWRHIPVVIASNLESDKDIDHGYALGAGEYIVKSNLSLSELVHKVTFLMNMSKNGRDFLAQNK